MADIIQGFGPQNVQLRFKDKEDGTHALVVEASVTLGDLTIDNSGVETRLGATNETAAASDTATSGLNGLFKRLLAGFTTLLSRVPALSSGRVPVDGSGVTQPVSIAATVVTSDSATTAINAKVPALGRAAAAASVPVVESSGQGNARIITSADGALTGLSFRQIVPMEDTICSVFTRTGLTGAATGWTMKAGIPIWGPVTAITVTSGRLFAYE